MLATMQRLGVVPSFSRPSVSNDNPFSESLFRTMKYVPAYPRDGFLSIDAARAWVATLVTSSGAKIHPRRNPRVLNLLPMPLGAPVQP